MYTTTNLIAPNTTTTTTGLDAFFGEMAIGTMILVIFLGLILLAAAIITIIAECKVFTKAGEKWWKVFIPVYNSWIQAKIAGLAWWWLPIFLVASALTEIEKLSFVAGMVVILTSFNYNFNIAKKFGKSNAFALLLTFLPFIGYPILGFGTAKYNASADTDKNGIFAINKDGLIK